jgi:hypothetical protein
VHAEFWWGNQREGDHLGDLGVEGMIILKWIFQEIGTGLIWLRDGKRACLCGHGNELFGIHEMRRIFFE